MTKRIYLDNNATTEVDKRVAEAVTEELLTPPSNPSSLHFFGKKAKNRLLQAREAVASYLQAKPQEILFMSSGTEAMNFLLRGLAPKSGHIISSKIEHACIENTLLSLEKEGKELTLLPADSTGKVPLEAIEKAIKEETKLLVFSAVNSETGAKMNLEALSSLAIKHQIPQIGRAHV